LVELLASSLISRSDQAKRFLLEAVWAPEIEQRNIAWPMETTISEVLRRQRRNWFILVEEWDEQSPAVRQALFRVIWRNANNDLDEFDPVRRKLVELLKADDDFERTESAILLARLQSTRAGEQSPNAPDDLHEQLEDVLVSALEKTPQGISLMDVVAAIRSARLDLDRSEERILRLIRQDSEEGKADVFRVYLTGRPRIQSENGKLYSRIVSRRTLLTTLLGLSFATSENRESKDRVARSLLGLLPKNWNDFSELGNATAELWQSGGRYRGRSAIQERDVKRETDQFNETIGNAIIEILGNQ
jgi:hypothetical protein